MTGSSLPKVKQILGTTEKSLKCCFINSSMTLLITVIYDLPPFIYVSDCPHRLPAPRELAALLFPPVSCPKNRRSVTNDYGNEPEGCEQQKQASAG